jgi:hypothetical protein
MGKESEETHRTIYDYSSGNYYHFDRRTGEALKCNVKGDPIPTFLHSVSGFADTSERKRRGYMPEVPVLQSAPDLPAILTIPAKYCGYTSCPRPGIQITAGSSQAYKLPAYLQPSEQKIGRVSTRAAKKEVKGDSWNPSKPSFVATLGSQFDDAMRMSSFHPESEQIRTNTDLLAVTARNKQVVLDEKGTLDVAMEKLRDQRTETKGRFGVRKPPYNSKDDTLDKLRQQRTKTAYWKGVNTLAKKTPNNAKDTFEEKSWINDIEENMDRVVNPTKWKKQDGAYDVDKYKVLQRQRDRYLQFFVEHEEQEEKMKRSELEMMKQNPDEQAA